MGTQLLYSVPFAESNRCCILRLVEPKHVYHRNLKIPSPREQVMGIPLLFTERWSEEMFAQTKQLWRVPCISGSQTDAGLKVYLLNKSCYKERL